MEQPDGAPGSEINIVANFNGAKHALTLDSRQTTIKELRNTCSKLAGGEVKIFLLDTEKEKFELSTDSISPFLRMKQVYNKTDKWNDADILVVKVDDLADEGDVTVRDSSDSRPMMRHLQKSTHKHILCDGCDLEIVGHRYKCIMCEDFDLCEICERAGKHPEHGMLRIVNPDTTLVPWGTRLRISGCRNLKKSRSNRKGQMFNGIYEAVSGISVPQNPGVDSNKNPAVATEPPIAEPLKTEIGNMISILNTAALSFAEKTITAINKTMQPIPDVEMEEPGIIEPEEKDVVVVDKKEVETAADMEDAKEASEIKKPDFSGHLKKLQEIEDSIEKFYTRPTKPQPMPKHLEEVLGERELKFMKGMMEKMETSFDSLSDLHMTMVAEEVAKMSIKSSEPEAQPEQGSLYPTLGQSQGLNLPAPFKPPTVDHSVWMPAQESYDFPPYKLNAKERAEFNKRSHCIEKLREFGFSGNDVTEAIKISTDPAFCVGWILEKRSRK